MTLIKNQASLLVATINGSGSQSANTILTKALFRLGLPVGAKNLFPSNIAGLPTWFMIRTHQLGFVSRENQADIVVVKNSETALEDLNRVKSGGFYFYESEFKIPSLAESRPDVTKTALPLREIVESTSDSIKMRKLLTNIAYVGVLAELLQIDSQVLTSCVRDQFGDKENVIELNLKAIELSREWTKNNLTNLAFPYRMEKTQNASTNRLLIDGNTAAALGALAGGCTFMSWYPITPSSSLAENFLEFAEKTRVHSDGTKKYSVLQAEDELSAINMVIGAGWAGSRAMTATSGPGLSLMTEAAGLSYFAEIPAVIWDVQRAGPSTGLPTRTLQSDLRMAAHLSHGDTEHLVLIPGTTEECFDFAQIAFDLAEEFQTLVIVLSDLDLGMNLSMAPEFQIAKKDYARGKVLSAQNLNERSEFARYRDIHGDGVPERTLPGTLHMKAAYFTRGTGHNENAAYTEDATTFEKLLNRLKKKFVTAKTKLPSPIISHHDAASHQSIGLIAFGSTDAVIPELRHRLQKKNIPTDYLRVRSLPLAESIGDFLKTHERIFIIEQNRDGQLRELLTQKFPNEAHKFSSTLTYDGWPVSIDTVAERLSL